MRKPKAEPRVRGWWFCDERNRLGYGDDRTPRIGITHSIKEHQVPRTCEIGMHASEVLAYALGYAGHWKYLYRVEVWGDLDFDHDKFCGRHRKYLARLTHDEVERLVKPIQPAKDILWGVLDERGVDPYSKSDYPYLPTVIVRALETPKLSIDKLRKLATEWSDDGWGLARDVGCSVLTELGTSSLYSNDSWATASTEKKILKAMRVR